MGQGQAWTLPSAQARRQHSCFHLVRFQPHHEGFRLSGAGSSGEADGAGRILFPF